MSEMSEYIALLRYATYLGASVSYQKRLRPDDVFMLGISISLLNEMRKYGKIRVYRKIEQRGIQHR